MQLPKITVLCFLLVLAAAPAQGRVFLQWTESAIPPAESMGVKQLVIRWAPGNLTLMETASKHGYQVFAETDPQRAAAAADSASKNGLAGIIVASNSDQPDQGTIGGLIQTLRRSHPGLAVFNLDTGAKQPQIRGNLVVNRDGVLEVSSPTIQPWIDSNVALTRFERAYNPGQVPLYTFAWDLTDPVERQEGPRAADYALAVAEAGAMRADVILPIHPNLQKALAEGNKTAWREWDKVKSYIRFYAGMPSPKKGSWADVAIVAGNYDETYEPMNLLARHNVPFVVLRPAEITEQRLSRLQLVILFSRPDDQAVHTLQAFASSGGAVVLINQRGPFPWDPLPAEKTAEGTTYKVGRGKIVSLAQPVGDPETFAEEVRGLLNRQGESIYLWNALTTLGFAYPIPHAGTVILDLVNYAQEPLQVQVRVRGSFKNVRYETPDHGFYPAITPEHENGFTEFVVPHLEIGGRVYLHSNANSSK
jgi:hypothetical protein